MQRSLWKTAFRATVPVLTGYLVLGMGFGILLRSNGFGGLWAVAMSLLIYAGSMQFLLVGLIAAHAPLLTVAVTALAVNARHLFYGVSMLERYRGAGRAKPYLIFALTDETYSLVCSVPESIPAAQRTGYCLRVTLLDHFYWVAGSAVGALLGAVLPFSTEGIDFALTALFLTVFLEQWLSTKKHLPAIVGVAASLLCLLLLGTEKFLIPAMLLIALTLLLLRRQSGEEAETE